MPVKLTLVSAVVVLALAALVAWLFDISFGRAAVLTPVFVLTLGAAAALVLLWAKVVLASVRRR